MADFIPDGEFKGDDDFVPDAHFVPDGENAPMRVEHDIPTKVIASPARPTNPYSHPSGFASAVQGFGEGIGVGPTARRVSAGLRATGDALTGGDFDYSKKLSEENDRLMGAAEDHPLVYAPSKVAGGITGAIRLGVAPFALLSGGNAAVEDPGGLADKVASGTNAAAVAALLGKLGQGAPEAKAVAGTVAPFLPSAAAGATRAIGSYLGTASPLTGMGVGLGFGAKTALDKDLPMGDRLAGALDPLAQAGSHFAAGKSRQAKALEPAHALAENDLHASVTEDARAEGAQRAKDQEYLQSQGVKAAEALNKNVDTAVGTQAGDAKDAFAKQRSNDRKALSNGNDSLRAADDKTQRTYETAKAAKAAEDKKANDARRLSGLEFREAQNKYNEQKADADAYVQEEAAIGKEKQARATRVRMIMAATDALRAAHTKEGESIRARMEEIKAEKAKAGTSAQAYFDGLHRELYDRATRHIAGSEALGQEPDSDIVASLRYLHSKHESLSPDKFKQLDEYADPATHAEALRKETAKRAGDTDAEMQGLSDRLNAESDPDFEARAKKQIADKEAASAALDARAMAAVDAEDAGKPGLRPKPADPQNPDTPERRQALIDFERNKILNPPAPLPSKPDRLQTKGAIRDANAAFRNKPGFVEPTIDRSGVAADLESGYMPMADLDTNSTPLQRAADIARRMQAARAQGGQNLDNALVAARVQPGAKVAGTPAEQYLRETQGKGLARAARAAAGTAAGAALGGVPGAAAGAYLGGKSQEPSPSVIAKYLSRGQDKEGVDRYSSPKEASVLLDSVQHYLEEKSPLSQKTNEKVAIAAAIAAFLEDQERKRKERR